MAHWAATAACIAPAAGAGKGRPEWFMLLAWAGSYLGFIAWLHPIMGASDHAVFALVYSACLPLLSRRTTPAVMAWLGGPICGLISGMQLIDLVFDLCILRNATLSDGASVYDGRRLAYLYYRAVLNSTHVNAVLLAIILVSFLGSFVGLGRSSERVRRQWLTLGACMLVGTGGYLVFVVTRYTKIRSSAAFDPSLFDGWGAVLFARLQLYASILVSLPLMRSMSLVPPGGDGAGTWEALAGKMHEQ